MKQITDIMNAIIDCVDEQASDLSHANAREMGEAIDMIKDLSMAEYYCTIIDAMNHSEYGVDYDLNGQIRGVPPIYANGKMTGRGSFQQGHSAVTDTGSSGDESTGNMSDYDKALWEYADSQDSTALGRLMDTIVGDMAELKEYMTSNDRTMAYQRLMALANTINS